MAKYLELSAKVVLNSDSKTEQKRPMAKRGDDDGFGT